MTTTITTATTIIMAPLNITSVVLGNLEQFNVRLAKKSYCLLQLVGSAPLRCSINTMEKFNNERRKSCAVKPRPKIWSLNVVLLVLPLNITLFR